MTEKENLFIEAMKECVMLTQELSKAYLSGVDSSLLTDNANQPELIVEYYRLTAVFEMLFSKNYLRDFSPPNTNLIKNVKKCEINDNIEQP